MSTTYHLCSMRVLSKLSLKLKECSSYVAEDMNYCKVLSVLIANFSLLASAKNLKLKFKFIL